MAKRKIAECINIRINVGNYQHIELTKYAEEEIEFDSISERQKKEDDLREDLLANMMRSMKAIPARLGKGVEQAAEVEEAIQKAIPAWLEKGAIPNIANGAKEKVIQITAEQKNNKDSQITVPEVKSLSKPEIAKIVELPKPEIDQSVELTALSEVDVKNLFEDDVTPSSEKKVDKPAKTDAKEDLKEFFNDDDDDLFSDV